MSNTMHEPKTFAEKLYEEKVLRGVGEENIQAILALKEEDFEEVSAEQFNAELQEMLNACNN